ncbi:uncharacterized protein VP01_2876g2, partial [Puccinia sorghi]
MDMLNARLDELMRMIRAQRLVMEETLRQNQAGIDATAGQKNPAHAQSNPAPTPASNPMVISKPQPFDGTHGATSKPFMGKIGLHAFTYPKRFPMDASKIVFAVSFMRDYAATWTKSSTRNQWYLMTSSMISDPASLIRHRVKVALRNLRQTGTVSAYTQDFNQHAVEIKTIS